MVVFLGIQSEGQPGTVWDEVTDAVNVQVFLRWDRSACVSVKGFVFDDFGAKWFWCWACGGRSFREGPCAQDGQVKHMHKLEKLIGRIGAPSTGDLHTTRHPMHP